MTISAVPTTTPAAHASRGSTALDGRDPNDDPTRFDRQLGTARQQLAPRGNASSPQHGAAASTSKEPPRAAADAAHDQRKVAGSLKNAVARPASTPADAAARMGTLAASDSPGNATDDSGDARADDKVKAELDTAGEYAVAATLAGAMLALLPSANAAMQALSGAATAAKTLKTGATGAGAGGAPGQGPSTLLPMGDAGSSSLTAANNAFVDGKADLSTLAAGLMPVDSDSKDISSLTQASAMLAAPCSTSTHSPALLQVQAPVGSQAFGQELGQQIAWLGGQAGQEIKQASIRLNPQDLGPIDVKVSVNLGHVDVVFNAQHPAAVTAVQQTLPQLDHLLAQHGLALGHAEVGQQQHRSDRHDTHGHRGRTGSGSEGDEIASSAGIAATSAMTISLLDAFA